MIDALRLRVVCAAVPLLLLVYAAARWVDGRDGAHGPGVAWNVGHVAFLVAFAGFGVVVVALARATARDGGVRRTVAAVTGTLGLVGVGLFEWVILGDLVPAVDEMYELPDVVMAVGPLLFLVGLAVPLGVLAWGRPRRLPLAAPLAIVAALVLIAVDLDLLAVAAVLFGYGLWSVPAALSPPRRGSGRVSAGTAG